MTACAQLADRLRDKAVAFDSRALILTTHERALADYDTTLAMANARPHKAAVTCGRILDAIRRGKASRTDMRDQDLIEARFAAARTFADGIDAIHRENEAIVKPVAEEVARAKNELADLTDTLEKMVTHDVPDTLDRVRALKIEDSVKTDKPEPEPVRVPAQRQEVASPPDMPAGPDTSTIKNATRVSDRERLEDLLGRIARNDIPILVPDDASLIYRVPGITRDELALVRKEHFAAWVQARLEGIAKIQRDRMAAAAKLLREHGRDGLECLSETDSDARRALKHLGAYKDHPVLLAMLAEPADGAFPREMVEAGAEATVQIETVPTRRTIENPPVGDTSPEQATQVSAPSRRGGLFGRFLDMLAPENIEVDVACELPPPAEVPNVCDPLAVVVPSTTQEEGIAAYAAMIRSHPDLRLIVVGGEISVDPESVPEWKPSVMAFSEEEEVIEAMRDRTELERHKAQARQMVQIVGRQASQERCSVKQLETVRRAPEGSGIAAKRAFDAEGATKDGLPAVTVTVEAADAEYERQLAQWSALRGRER